jgi:hypothetical protein
MRGWRTKGFDHVQDGKGEGRGLRKDDKVGLDSSSISRVCREKGEDTLQRA